MSSPPSLPTVSICTPTFNRRPFIPAIVRCIQQQTYPLEKIEWIVFDDGTDKIGDLVASLPWVRYISSREKRTLGYKRNHMNAMATGEIIVCMDDDDYYPPSRVAHAVETLQRCDPNILCAGSSLMHIYFKDRGEMYAFGPYGANHATAATLAFRRELLSVTQFDNSVTVGEDKTFLQGHTIPLVQLDPVQTILVFSHPHSTCDKRELLDQPGAATRSSLTPRDMIRDSSLREFYLEEIDKLLPLYKIGELSHKPDVQKHIDEMRAKREAKQRMHICALDKENARLTEKVASLTLTVSKLEEDLAHSREKLKQIISSKINAQRSAS